MKKILFYISVLIIVISGCKKSSYVPAFDKTPQERAGEQIALVSTTLTSAPNGWIATLPTQAGGGYSFYMTFDNNQNVVMYSDMTNTSAATGAKSYYRIKQDLGTDLVFDSYNYISMLDDPNSDVLGGASKVGYSSDIDFIYDRSSADSIIFIGKKYRQPFKLVKATAAQKAIYEAGGFKTAIDRVQNFITTNKFPYLEIPSGSSVLKAGIAFNTTNNLTSGKRITLTGVLADGVTATSGVGKFSFSLDGGDILNAGLTYGGISFVKFSWKDATTLAFYDSTGKEYIVKNSPSPVTPLFILLGSAYTVVSLPNAATYQGWGADYVARRAASDAAFFAAYKIHVENMVYTFNESFKKLTLTVNIPQTNTTTGAITQYVGTLNYTYTKTSNGVYKFTYVDYGTNGDLVNTYCAPLLAQRLNVDTFTVDYMINSTTGALMAIFTSVQNPAFSFTGNL
ncbi:DUF4302 domain-containing protein [Pedobacter nototheniae]|uniref:DUF4302 domain-containing protein n=1 Tax=Pedobacter nototheniae TaxID=2488994 RepID=UPI00292D1F2F|nr:DUF4302 domain-containing protein [Pedobacter nototheniae]